MWAQGRATVVHAEVLRDGAARSEGSGVSAPWHERRADGSRVALDRAPRASHLTVPQRASIVRGMTTSQPLVGVVMGSRSDWDTMKNAVETLEALAVPHEVKVVSAHRTPELLFEYADAAEERGLEVIIAGAGGAAHLPGMLAAKTVLPVFGVPVQSRSLQGLDSLLSIVQMPGGIPVGTLAIGVAGAVNAALLAAQVLGAAHPEVRDAVRRYREDRTRAVLADPDPRKPHP